MRVRIELNAVSPNLIGGYDGNAVSQGVSGASVGGGGRPATGVTTAGDDGDPNLVTDDFGAIGGGIGNQAGNGSGTTADAPYASIGGGSSNTASATGATVPGGSGNIADGVNSFAAGTRASAAHDGSFVWSDPNPPLSIGPRFVSTAENQFLIRARGGVGINTNAPVTELDVGGTVRMTGLELPTGAGAGLVLTSDGDGVASWLPGGGGGSGWGLDGNIGTDSSSDFIGTSDDEGLEFRVNGLRALRIEPTSSIPNLIGAFGSVGEGVVGATVGGGSGLLSNLHGVVGDYGTVGGGFNNRAEAGATVSGGIFNGAFGTGSTVSGGSQNQASTSHGTVGGGFANRALAGYATIAGGGATDTLDATTGNQVLSDYGTIGGGGGNRAGAEALNATYATVGGGEENTASGSSATVSGGSKNEASGSSATVGGGSQNTASQPSTTVGGGVQNAATGSHSTISGGQNNEAAGMRSTIAGGRNNVAGGSYSFAVGRQNLAQGEYSFAVGRDNEATGDHSFALGRRAKVPFNGCFVWADRAGVQGEDFIATGADQFLVRASGGVGINTSNPLTALHVRGETTNGHIAFVENMDTGSNPDVLALRVGTQTPGTSVNFITFFNGDSDPVGTIEAVLGGVTLKSGSGDFAEWLPKKDEGEMFEPGDVVGVFGGKISKRTEGAHHLMVVSERPIVLGNAPPEAQEYRFAPVAFVGQVRTKVRGPGAVGDYLVASGFGDGTAIAVSPDSLENEDFARIVGRAWESSRDDSVKRINTVVGLPLVSTAQQVDIGEQTGALAAIQELHEIVKDKDAEIALQKNRIESLESRVKKLEEMVRMIAGKDYENGLPSGE